MGSALRIVAPGQPNRFAPIVTQIATTRLEWSYKRQLAVCRPIWLDYIFQAFTVVAAAWFSRNGPCYILESAPQWRWSGAGNAGSARFLQGCSENGCTRFPFREGRKGSQRSMGVTARRRHIPALGR